MYKKKFFFLIFFILIIFFNTNTFSKQSENVSLANIKKYAKTKQLDKLNKAVINFLRNNPKSKHIADVRLIAAVYETDPEQALKKLIIIKKYYKYFKKRDYTIFKICELYYLFGQWKNLEKESLFAIKTLKTSRYNYYYKYFLAKSYFYLRDFNKSANICKKLLKSKISNSKKSEIKLLLSYINYHLTGKSTAYKIDLKQIYELHNNKETKVSALFLFAVFCNQKKEYSKAYSAFKDIIKKYPKSPEAKLSKEQILKITKYNPTYTSTYFPVSNKSSNNIDLNISPEYEIKEANNIKKSKNYYTISIGPLYNLKQAIKLKKIIAKEFSPVIIIKKRKKFVIYVNNTKTTDQAITTKVRLAEEFGLNGNIIFVKIENGRKYYYGD